MLAILLFCQNFQTQGISRGKSGPKKTLPSKERNLRLTVTQMRPHEEPLSPLAKPTGNLSHSLVGDSKFPDSKNIEELNLWLR
mmetsp:Transcript_7324/g.11035  ORF Transcript_7324/g.11035 Transcript_7324/m.11035 type:complete len:83 (+) Transcript_7324:272-520(+)